MITTPNRLKRLLRNGKRALALEVMTDALDSVCAGKRVTPLQTDPNTLRGTVSFENWCDGGFKAEISFACEHRFFRNAWGFGGDIWVHSTYVKRRTGWFPVVLSDAHEEWLVDQLLADDE